MFRRKESIGFLIATIVLLCSFSVNAGLPPNIDWQKCLGWTENYGDEGVKIIHTQDGNHLLIGKKTLQGVEGFWIAKTNPKGNIIWEMSVFDNDSYTGLRPVDATQAPDGGYIIVGKVINIDRLIFSGYQGKKIENAVNYHGYIDNLVMKLDANGQFVWQKVFGGSGEDTPVRILTTNDSNFMMIGHSNSTDGDLVDTGKNTATYNRDLWIVKLNQNGEVLTKKCIGGGGDDMPFDAEKTSDGGYIISGNTNSDIDQVTPNKGGKDVLVMKLDGNCNVSWKKSIGGSQNDEARSVVQIPNGDYMLGIVSNSLNQDFQFTANTDFPNNFQENIWLFQLNGGGNIQQKKIFGGSRKDFLNDMVVSRDGSVLIVGSTNSDNGSIADRNRISGNNNDKQDVLLMKIDGGMGIQWERTIGGSSDDEALSVLETGDGGVLVFGTTFSLEGDVSGNHWGNNDNKDMWLAKLTEPCEQIKNTSQDLVAVSTNVLASEAVNTSDRVSQNSFIRYGANKNVDLLDGFNSETGSTVEVSLYGCTGSGGGVSNQPIQVKMINECREGGMKFKFQPFTPDNDLSQYRISVQNLDPRVPFSFSNGVLITKNNGAENDKNAFFLVTVSRDGYADFHHQGYTSTCDHDGNPTECPENTHDLVLDKQYYKAGDTFTAKWTGGLLAGQGMQWFPDNVSITFQSEDEVRGVINSFPASIQAQPSASNYPKPCHGAVKVLFDKEK